MTHWYGRITYSPVYRRALRRWEAFKALPDTASVLKAFDARYPGLAFSIQRGASVMEVEGPKDAWAPFLKDIRYPTEALTEFTPHA